MNQITHSFDLIPKKHKLLLYRLGLLLLALLAARLLMLALPDWITARTTGGISNLTSILITLLVAGGVWLWLNLDKEQQYFALHLTSESITGPAHRTFGWQRITLQRAEIDPNTTSKVGWSEKLEKRRLIVDKAGRQLLVAEAYFDQAQFTQLYSWLEQSVV